MFRPVFRLPGLRTLFFACAASLLALLGFFVVVEAAFQISNRMRMQPPMLSPAKVGSIVYDPDLLYRPRDLPVPGPKKGGRRVLILGDSLITAPPGHITLVDRLQWFAARNTNLPAAEWINGGVAGYTNYQELVFLKKFGIAMQPDVVGVVFCLNDVHRYLVEVGVRDAEFRRTGVTADATAATQGRLLRLARRSLFLSWLKNKTELARKAVDMYESKGYDFDYRPDLSTAWQDSPWDMIREQMNELVELGVAHNFRLFLVVVPFAEQYRADYLARDASHVLKPQRILSDIATSAGIPILDLYPFLSKGSFVSDLIHMNELGQERAAEKIAEFLLERDLLAGMPNRPHMSPGPWRKTLLITLNSSPAR
jgi:lysophospholipase L1-like esterase